MVDQILQELELKGYSYLPALVKPHELKIMADFFEEKKAEFKPAMVGPTQSKQRRLEIRGDNTFWIDPLNPPVPFVSLIRFLNNLKSEINEKFYLGLREFECHLAFYPPGTFYKKHLDRFESSGTRSLSFVFYLNEHWGNDDGGELVIYNLENEILAEVKPLPGSFICFISEEFPHEVKSAKIERRSFTGWMHTKTLY